MKKEEQQKKKEIKSNFAESGMKLEISTQGELGSLASIQMPAEGLFKNNFRVAVLLKYSFRERVFFERLKGLSVTLGPVAIEDIESYLELGDDRFIGILPTNTPDTPEYLMGILGFETCLDFWTSFLCINYEKIYVREKLRNKYAEKIEELLLLA